MHTISFDYCICGNQIFRKTAEISNIPVLANVIHPLEQRLERSTKVVELSQQYSYSA